MTHLLSVYLTMCLAAVVLHELAHIAVARSVGLKVKRIGINWKGAYIVREPGPPLLNSCAALAGPMMNLLLALLFQDTLPKFAQLNLALGLFNLLPFQSSDGARVLGCWKEAYATKRAEPARTTADTSKS